MLGSIIIPTCLLGFVILLFTLFSLYVNRKRKVEIVQGAKENENISVHCSACRHHGCNSFSDVI